MKFRYTRNIIFIFLCVVFINSCCVGNAGRVNEFGRFHPKKPNFSIDYLDNPILDSIVINSIYELDSFWLGKPEFYSSLKQKYQPIYPSQPELISFIRLYNNGDISFMYRYKDSVINRDTFNPLKGDFGKLKVENIQDELITERYSFVVGNSGEYLKGKIKMLKDTIYLIEKVANYYQHHYYIRKDIPKAYLVWEANW